MDWASEIPKMCENIRRLEKEMFEDVDIYISECCSSIDEGLITHMGALT
jgi:hypothetical protein